MERLRADHRRDLADAAKEQELALAQATVERNQQHKEYEARENELRATIASLVHEYFRYKIYFTIHNYSKSKSTLCKSNCMKPPSDNKCLSRQLLSR